MRTDVLGPVQSMISSSADADRQTAKKKRELMASFITKPSNLCLGLFWARVQNPTTAPSLKNTDCTQEKSAFPEQAQGDGVLNEYVNPQNGFLFTHFRHETHEQNKAFHFLLAISINNNNKGHSLSGESRQKLKQLSQFLVICANQGEKGMNNVKEQQLKTKPLILSNVLTSDPLNLLLGVPDVTLPGFLPKAFGQIVKLPSQTSPSPSWQLSPDDSEASQSHSGQRQVLNDASPTFVSLVPRASSASLWMCNRCLCN